MNAVAIPELAALNAEKQNTIAIAKDFKITSPEHFRESGELLKGIKALQKKIADTFDPHIRRAHDAHKALVKQKNDETQPLEQAESILKRSILTYQQEQERIRQEQERKAREAAEKEQARLREQAAKAEAEARAKADALRKQAEEAEAAGRAAEAAKLAQRAENTEQAGTAKAEALQEKASIIPTPVIAVNTPSVAGISTRKAYSAKVTDKAALIKAIAEGKAPDNIVEPNMTVLNALARSLKEGFSYPGVELVTEGKVASRAA